VSILLRREIKIHLRTFQRHFTVSWPPSPVL
jgi:hypothetical protein